MKVAKYENRYGDKILFSELSANKVKMSGYGPWYRYGWCNDYAEAYQVYTSHCNALTEPDYLYLVEDMDENKLRPRTYQEFVYEVENNEEYRSYLGLVRTDMSRINMFDPSGGPYVELGTNIGRYFDDGIDRIVEEITFHEDSVELVITAERKKNKQISKYEQSRTKH
tara:strand:+ start:946 stop:1449 length:504 start_codon:yes stop_codon:yes gene_type:complete